MVRVISQHRQQAETDDIKVPNAEVYSMKGELRTEVVQQNDDELEAIKQEIMELYPDRADAIALQKDYGASVYFQSLQDKGPSPNYLKALELVRNHPEYKDFFIAKKNQASDGDEEEDENDEDSKDSDHTPEETQHNRATSPRLLRTRQRTYSMDPPEL
ncbi:hypothetical protein EDD21DRAFT_356013 [Dissophora ornata]|nr:hypothetical protein EDD21DRAFT_356013 [Dissophora ornata]